MVMSVNEGVAFCLRPMKRVGNMIPYALNGFDFLQQHLLWSDEHAVDATLDAQDEFVYLQIMTNGNLLLVTFGTGFLDPLVASRSSQSPARADKKAFTTEIATP